MKKNNTSKSIERQNLLHIKVIIDAYNKGELTITIGNKDNDPENNVYDISHIMSKIENYVYNGLYLT